MPFGTKHSPIYFATTLESIKQQIRMKTEIKIIKFVDDIYLLHQNKDYVKNMTQRLIDTLIYFGFTMNTEKCETEPNQTVIFLGWEWILANATVKTKPKKQTISCKTERMKYKDDNEQNRRSIITHQRHRCSPLTKFSQIWKRICSNNTDFYREH
ncbi:MAG: hypothetical protein EZS28_043898 [Streblomastix strix]|uniref:Reverse transcriptase domain-containing protein n=1 Tax=Streblomastix strix TaxID=222440 RepID=A0A5J4TQ37_9EUKA|nr:MAG: hypothetical protein EZS28_043898 [Streblomastix strix]